MQHKAQPRQANRHYQSYQEGAYQLPGGRKPAVGLGVVVVLHLLFFWALNAGLGRELLHTAPVLVMAQLLTPEPPSPPAAVPPPPPPSKAATPPPAPVAPLPVPVLEPTPVAAVPTPAIVLAPAPPAPVATPAPAPAAVYTPPPPAVRVAATLQASGSCQKPEYPALSRKREEQGAVVLKFLIGVDGRVLDSQIEQSSGYARLDEAARAGLSKCQFKPGTVDGKPEASWASLKYTWHLE
jgi:protein TonB